MAAPVLTDYEYQFKDDGIKLNGNVVLPYIDVDSVKGIDLAEIEVTEADVDGVHGGVIIADFFKARTIVIDCTIYAVSTTIDAFMDQLHANFMPTSDYYPFYFKGAGIVQRFILCKSVGLKYDIDTLRRVGSCRAQIILKAGDPRKYVETTEALSSGNYITRTNSGNIPTYPIYTITGGTQTVTAFRNGSTGRQISINNAMALSDILTVDFNRKMVFINGIRQSSVLGTGFVDWWEVRPGSNQLQFSTWGPTGFTIPTGTVTWRSGWV